MNLGLLSIECFYLMRCYLRIGYFWACFQLFMGASSETQVCRSICKTVVIRCAVRWEIDRQLLKPSTKQCNHAIYLALVLWIHDLFFIILLDALFAWRSWIIAVRIGFIENLFLHNPRFLLHGIKPLYMYAGMGLIPGSCNVAVKLLHLIWNPIWVSSSWACLCYYSWGYNA